MAHGDTSPDPGQRSLKNSRGNLGITSLISEVAISLMSEAFSLNSEKTSLNSEKSSLDNEHSIKEIIRKD